MPSPLNISNIPAPRVEFIDPRTGLMAREWYRFFFNLFNLTGGGANDTSLSDLQIGPPPINQVLGELGIVYDQAQLASMMAQYEQSIRDVINQIETAPAMPQLGTMAPLQQDNVPWFTFDTTPGNVPPNVATLYWDDGEGTLDVELKGGNVTCKIGVQEYVRAYNETLLTMTKGQIVYISGAQGNRVAVKLAQADGDANSAHTIGIVAETIAAGGEGFVQVSGPIYKLNTIGTTAGDTVYLSPTIAGDWTTTKPVAPDHLVIIGFIERVHASVGSIFIKIDNGYELEELHNVRITSVANNDLLQYDSTGPYWKNVTPSSIEIGTATNLAGGTTGSVPYQSAASTTTFLPIGTASQVLKVNAGATAPEWVSGAALTTTNDTNVTLTLGGSPSTALLAASSLTLGWAGQLSVLRGGTGTGAAFTAGSVVFAGASGTYSQDNANLFWDDTNNRFGIGTTSPTRALHVASPNPTAFFDRDGGNPAAISLRSGRGTIASPSQTLANDTLGVINAFGYTNTSAYTSAGRAGLWFYAAEAFTASAQGTYLTLETTPTGTAIAAERMRIDSAGNVGIGTTAPAQKLDVAGVVAADGIQFPAVQVSSADANTLDDYDEGTWTAAIIGTTTAGTGTYSTQVGRYTKIGRVVHVNCRLVWSAHTGTGNMQISGLPFVSENVSGSWFGVNFGVVTNIALTAGYVITGYIQTNTSVINLQQYPTGGGASIAVPLDTAGTLVVSATYHAAT